MVKGRMLVLLLAACGLAGFAPAGAQARGYQVIRRVHLAGNGGWDFLTLDRQSRRLYVTHADSVQVLDADSLKLVGTIPDVPRPHGVVLLPQLGKGYISSGDPGSVVVFDLQTLQKVGEIPSHKDTDVILYDDYSHRLFTFNGDSHDCTVIDPKTDKVVKFIKLGGAPEFAVSDGHRHIYDNLESRNQVLRINTRTLRIERRWPVAPGESPTGLALDARHDRLFIGCRNRKLVVMNTINGKVMKTFPIGAHVDATVFDPKSGKIFSSCGDGTLSVVREESPDRFRLVEDAKTEPGARTMAFDPKTGRIFTDTADSVPDPTGHSKFHRKIVPDTFRLLVVGK